MDPRNIDYHTGSTVCIIWGVQFCDHNIQEEIS